MKKYIFLLIVPFCFMADNLFAQQPALTHPNTSAAGWTDLFNADLTNGIFQKGIWSSKNGVITATKDTALWSKNEYTDFILDLEFKNSQGTNSGVFVHGSNMREWVDHSVEIQIADDFDPEWANSPASWQCGAIFGHQAASKHMVKKPGEWNHYTISCIGRKIWVVLNGALINKFDMSKYTSAKINVDGTKIPEWLSKPLAVMPLKGHIGFQGLHAGAPVYFRNIRIKPL
ncbi:MAG: DUF1080 domain-containing protein [Bacteroidota bacterium]|nr:DUF1080 domain-containing protein [Bacteroidota bacterium]MDP4212986.1 DUF1080 domain-containing protein [Bacteroidota bacterium]MDP4249974.1 DUF1080 domain-containing protein [Bacteroidota bacterium]